MYKLYFTLPLLLFMDFSRVGARTSFYLLFLEYSVMRNWESLALVFLGFTANENNTGYILPKVHSKVKLYRE